MFYKHSVCLLASSLLAALALASAQFLEEPVLKDRTDGFIIEFSDTISPMNVMSYRFTAQVLEATGLQVMHKMDLRGQIFNGASYRIANDNIGLSDGQDLLGKLRTLPNVAAVWPNTIYKLPPSVQDHTHILADPDQDATRTAHERNMDYTVSPSREEMFVEAHGPHTPPAQSHRERREVYPYVNSSVNPHAMTGVDKLHEAGILGKDVKIAILDSGIDAFHPTFGGAGIGPGLKVAGGWDFMGDSGNQFHTMPDASPQTDCHGHGTETSSVAAGLPYKFGFVGVAPNATLYHYRIANCNGNSLSDIMVAAILKACDDGVDIISISYTIPWGTTRSSAVLAAFSRVMDKGILPILSGGNYGSAGTFQNPYAPGSTQVPRIGSVDNVYVPSLLANGSFSVNGGLSVPIKYMPGFPANWSSPLELVVGDLGRLGQKQCPFDLEGNVTFTPQQLVLLPAACARYWDGLEDDLVDFTNRTEARNFLLYRWHSLEPGSSGPTLMHSSSPASLVDGIGDVDEATALRLTDLASKGNNITLDLPWKPKYDLLTRMPELRQNNISGGFMSAYSTWGPTYDANLGSVFSAPGGKILAAEAKRYGGLAVVSGTSFSAPYVAGVAALIKQSHPSIAPQEIINRLASTSRPLRMQFHDLSAPQDYLAPVFQQGGGLIDAWAAVYSTTTLNISCLAFNDTAHMRPLGFEIKNYAAVSVTYNISHTPGPSLHAFAHGEKSATHFDESTVFQSNVVPDAHAGLEFSSSSITISPSSSAVITVAATIPSGLDAQRVPLYSGFVTIRSSNGEALSLPYGGIAARLRDVHALDTSPAQKRFRLISMFNTTKGWEYSPEENSRANFTLPRVFENATMDSRFMNIRLPGYSFSALFGYPRFEVHLLHDGASLGEVRREDPWSRVLRDDPSYLITEHPRIGLFGGRMADGRRLENGAYQFMIRALRLTGNPDVEEDWDQVLTESFTLTFTD